MPGRDDTKKSVKMNFEVFSDELATHFSRVDIILTRYAVALVL